MGCGLCFPLHILHGMAWPVPSTLTKHSFSHNLSGNRRIAPASSKPASLALPSTVSFKADQKIQLGGQIINVSDLQGFLKGRLC